MEKTREQRNDILLCKGEVAIPFDKVLKMRNGHVLMMTGLLPVVMGN